MCWLTFNYCCKLSLIVWVKGHKSLQASQQIRQMQTQAPHAEHRWILSVQVTPQHTIIRITPLNHTPTNRHVTIKETGLSLCPPIERPSLFYCVWHIQLGVSQAGTENTASFFQMGPLCPHKSTNSFSANRQSAVRECSWSYGMNERFLVVKREAGK